jgi:Xaa-Pro aminopeptidase
MKELKKLRLAKLRQKMLEQELQSLIINSPSNVYYLSGFTGTNATLFITLENSYLLTDFRYMEQATKEAELYEILRVDNDLLETLGKLTKEISFVGIEEDYISCTDFRQLQKVLSSCILLDASNIVREMRQVKDEAEIEILRQAITITDQAFVQILEKIKPGITEEEVGLELEYILRRRGASGRSFEFIVASGERSASPHGVATTKKINYEEFLTLDFGAKYKGYCSDLTRTVFVGEPTARHKDIYEIVLEAQETALKIIKPGLSGQEVDAVAREIISKFGYGEYFGHGLGHSVGLEIHETPRLNTKENRILKPGMIITVEPGIYIPNWGGVRIEDMVLVTPNGVEVLTRAPKQFIIID